MERNPWRGKGAIVWQAWQIDVEKLIAAARRLGLEYVDVKIGNGGASWVRSGARAGRIREAIAALKAAGLRVTGWTYNYLDGRGERFHPDDGDAEREAAVAVEAVRLCGLDGITLDLEIEVEGHAETVAACLDMVRASADVPVAAFTWADLDGHDGYPIAEIVARVDVVRPMCYRPVWTAGRMFRRAGAGERRRLADHVAGRAISVAWGVTEARATDLAADLAHADRHGIAGESYWEAAALLERLDELAPTLAPRRFAPPTDLDRLDRELWTPLYRLKDRAAALGRPDLYAAIERAYIDDKVRAGAQPA